MYKLILLVVLSFSSALNAVAQNASAQSSKELLMALQKSKADTNRISLQLKLGYYYLYKPHSKPESPAERKHNLDSAINFFSQALQLSVTLHETDWQYIALDKITEYNWLVPEHSKQISIWAVTYSHKKSKNSKEADAWQRLAGTSVRMDKFNYDVLDRIGYYQHARALYLQDHQLEEAAADLSNIANLRILIKQFDQAEKDLQQSLAEYKASGFEKLHYPYMLLVNLEYDRGNYYRAIAYCLEGIKNTTADENILVTSRFYWYAAKCNFAVKKYPEALTWIKKAVEIGGTPNVHRYLPVETLLALNNADEALKSLNEIAKVKSPKITAWDTLNQYKCLAIYYAIKNNTDASARYYQKTLAVARKHFASVGSTWAVICDNGVAAVYLKAAQAAKAEKYINDAAFNLRSIKIPMDPAYWVDFYDNSYKYHLATSAYQSAVFDLQHRVQLQDSLFTADRDKQLAELDIQYQTAQQEQSIKNLHSESAAQEAKLEKANLERNLTIAGILLMIAISVLFYRNYNQKQAANKVITQKNELLQHLLTQKEWLLKEVHHRVKNNLHTVISLLESQAAYLEDDALKAIENSRHRIYAMSLIHQKLYQSDDIKTIDMSVYIPELVNSLKDGFDIGNQIRFRLDIDPVRLTVSYAVPIGLIINEGVTNSIKYAFPGKRKGEISISLVSSGDRVTLEVADDGIGMPQFDHKAQRKSLGLHLIKGLAKEIGAEIDIVVENGTKIIMISGPDALNDPDSFLKTTEIEEDVNV